MAYATQLMLIKEHARHALNSGGGKSCITLLGRVRAAVLCLDYSDQVAVESTCAIRFAPCLLHSKGWCILHCCIEILLFSMTDAHSPIPGFVSSTAASFWHLPPCLMQTPTFKYKIGTSLTAAISAFRPMPNAHTPILGFVCAPRTYVFSFWLLFLVVGLLPPMKTLVFFSLKLLCVVWVSRRRGSAL